RSAMATFLWLYENDNDPNRQLQNLARASVAAARAGDRAEFARTFRLLAGQEDRSEPGDDKPVATKKKEKSDKTDKTEKADKPKVELKARDGSMIASAESDKVREKRR